MIENAAIPEPGFPLLQDIYFYFSRNLFFIRCPSDATVTGIANHAGIH
jgi:hypothetical protein